MGKNIRIQDDKIIQPQCNQAKYIHMLILLGMTSIIPSTGNYIDLQWAIDNLISSIHLLLLWADNNTHWVVHSCVTPLCNEFVWWIIHTELLNCHGISNHCQLDCLFNYLLRLITKKASKLHVTENLWGEPPLTGPVMQNAFPWHVVIMGSVMWKEH